MPDLPPCPWAEAEDVYNISICSRSGNTSRAAAAYWEGLSPVVRTPGEHMPAELMQGHDEMQPLTDATSALIAYVDDAERCRYLNRTFEAWLGLRAEQIRGYPLREVLGEKVYAEIKSYVNRVLNGEEVCFERRQPTADGRALQLSAHCVPRMDRRGRVRGFFALLTDVTSLKAKELELRKLEMAVTQNPATVLITDPAGNIEYVNPKFEQLTGYSFAEIRGKNPRILRSENMPIEVYEDLWRTIKGGQVWRGDIQNRKRNGELFWESEIISPITNDKGEITHFIAVKEDITERKKSEQRLYRLNRTLRLISECNEALVHSHAERDLVNVICNEIVDVGGYRMAWVGYAQTDEDRTVRPVAFAGHDGGFLESVKISWADVPHGQDTSGTAIRSGLVVAAGDILTHPRYAPWQAEAGKRGYASSVALPLKDGTGTFGVLNIYSSEPDAFDTDEIKLLGELADDLAYGIVSLRTREERRKAVEALAESEERFRSISSSAQDAIVMVDERGAITYWNPAAEQVFGYRSVAVLGKNLHQTLFPSQCRQDGETGLRQFPGAQGEATVGKIREVSARRADGSEFPAELSMGTVKIRGKAGAVGVIRDITERKHYQEQLEHRAAHDPLTGLPNRVLLKDRIEQAIAQARRHGSEVAVMLVDLDRFKNVNDSFGHPVGDVLLQKVAHRLGECLRGTDTVARLEGETVARLGGDEFTLVLSEMANEERLNTVIQRVLAEISKPYEIEGREFIATCSIGISLYPGDGSDVDTLMRNADAALYQAKEGGGNNYQFYTAELNAKAFERLSVETDLRRALSKQEFSLHYQPQVDVITGELIGTEALLRWRHPKLGMVPPDRFIPIAEDSGLIVPLGEWVLREACRQNKAWQDAGFPPIPVAVNISTLQFRQQNFTETVTWILAETGLSPKYLELEITESLMMHDAQRVVEQLSRLKALGVQLAIDDFGAGYSSLSYLKRIPVNKVKIDMSFVREITSDPDSAAIAAVIIGIGHTLRLQVIAEGVETLEQFSVLKAQGCDHTQGYYFSRPLPPGEFQKQFMAIKGADEKHRPS